MASQFPIIRSERLLLRQFTNTDLINVFKGLSHPDVIKHYGISFDSIEATKEQMTWFTDLEKNETGIWWAICELHNNEFVGAGGFNNLNKILNKSEIGFWLLPEFWGNGYMKEAMSLICEYGFETLKLHRIEGFVETGNLNCKKGLEKLNFKNEKTLKDYEKKNGHSISLDIYVKKH